MADNFQVRNTREREREREKERDIYGERNHAWSLKLTTLHDANFEMRFEELGNRQCSCSAHMCRVIGIKKKVTRREHISSFVECMYVS